MSPDPIDILIRCLKIYSPTNGEERLSAHLMQEMNRLGYSHVRTDRAGNAIGDTGRGGLRVLLCGHMDTVPGMLPVRHDSGIIYGRGAADAKAALCALLVAGSRLSDSGARVTFAGVTREEGDSLGVKTLIKSRMRLDYAVFGEPAGYRRITIGYRGRVGLHVTVRTEGGHAGSPWAHPSAFDEFNSFVRELAAYAASQSVSGDNFRSISITPTIVKAGTYHNVVPSRCDATVDVRIPPGISSSQVISKIKESATMYSSSHRASVFVSFDEPTEPYEADTSSPLVRAFQRAIIGAGGKPSLIRKTGTGDMNDLAAMKHIQSVTYGPGDPTSSHTDMERVEVEDYLKAIDVIEGAVRQLVSLRGG